MLVHPIPPFYRADSHILILGSFPSVKSREMMFFYGHPQNRFWKVMAAVFGDAFPEDVPARAAFLERHRLAAWDVIRSCDITGSSDASIRNATVNDLSVILDHAPIERIIANGQTAGRLYQRYALEKTQREALVLPSTSPANASWSLERLISVWKEALTI